MRRSLILIGLWVAGCAASSPAPIAYGGRAQPARAERAARAAPIQVRQEASQPAPDWAAAPGASLGDYALQPNGNDPAHPPRTHRVGAHESLYDIAATYQIPVRALIDQNHLEPPFALAPGREIQLPPPRTHRIARGESFESVARAYNVDLRSLALLNRMRPPYVVHEGDQIVLPAVARGVLTAEVGPAPSNPSPARIIPPPAQTETPLRTPAVQAPATPPPANVHFSWPVRGEILTRFGAQPGGSRLDGVEIAAAEGASIGAADAGEVVYAGSDLNAYGTLVLVRHENGYVTAYGYARRALVREGQHVRAGQAIAEVGRVRDGPPRLLFQVRRGREAIDPLPLLGAT